MSEKFFPIKNASESNPFHKFENERDVFDGYRFAVSMPVRDPETSEAGSGFATVYLNRFAHRVTGFAGESYMFRDNDDELQEYAVESLESWMSTGNILDNAWDPERKDEEVVRFLEPYFKEGIVAELGCGFNGDGYIVADSLKAKGYIGLETRYPNATQDKLSQFEGETPFYIVPIDFSKYLRQLIEKEKRLDVIIMVGIDEFSYKGEVPLEELGELINKVLNEKGVFISDIAHLFKKDFKIIRKIKTDSEFERGISICEKIK